MNKIFLGTVFFLCSLSSLAQDGPQQNSNDFAAQFGKIASVPNSPEAEAFTKYGELDVNLFSGTPNISIPLYTIVGKELSVPISLTYDASGVKVNQIATNVGLNWNLNVGGRISRQTRGLPDHGVETPSPKDASVRQKILQYKDAQQLDGNGNYQVNGALFYNNNFEIAKNNVIDYYEFLHDVSKGNIDIEQDYFSVNVLGLNETLWMDTATYTPEPLKNRNLVIEAPISFNNDPLSWVLLDEQGNRYYFGKAYDGNEPYDTNNSEPIEQVNRIHDMDVDEANNFQVTYNSSWLLTKIVSSNGADVFHFEYTQKVDFADPSRTERINQSTSHGAMDIGGGTPQYAGAGAYPLLNKVSSVKSQFTQQFLKAIYHNGREVVRFSFVDRTDVEQSFNKAIKDITIYRDYGVSTTPIDKIEFDYSYFGDPNAATVFGKRLKLDKITMGINDPENYYAFDYNSPQSVPSRLSNAFDTMGYFNGQESPTPFKRWYRDMGNNQTELELPGASRAVSPSNTKVGMLTRLRYPTGGFSEFEFENHSNGTDIYPGLRIKEIKGYSGEGFQETRKHYSYTSMVQNYTPILDFEMELEPSPCPNGSFNITPMSLQRYALPPNMDSGAYISYPEVIEHLDNNGQPAGYTKYQFSTGVDEWNAAEVPPYQKRYDNSNYTGSPLVTEMYEDGNPQALKTVANQYTLLDNGQTIYDDETFTIHSNSLKSNSFVQVYKNGNALDIFTQGGAICGTIDLTLLGIDSTTIPQVDDCVSPTSVCFATQGWAALEHRPVSVSAYADRVTLVTTTEYFGGQSITTTTSSEYNNTDHLLRATVAQIDNGDSMRTEYTYPQDITNRTPAEQRLLDDNKKTIPIISRTKRLFSGGGERLLTTNKTEYNIFTFGQDSLALPKHIQFEKGGDENNPNLETRIIYQHYDEWGNAIEASMEDGAPISYVWGYDREYLVAKIDNRTRASLSASLVQNVETANEASIAGHLALLRDHVNATGGFITTYTYQPLIGVSTITDARGTVQTFKYDEQNRMEFALDQDNKVLAQNSYHRRSKEALSGAQLEVSQQGIGFIEFEVNTSLLQGDSGPYQYTWVDTNGSSILPVGDGSKGKVLYNCNDLNGDDLEIACIVYDNSNNEYQPQKISTVARPSNCIITANMVATPMSSGGINYIEFKLENLSGGDGTYQNHDWNVSSLGGGITPGSPTNSDPNIYNVTYDCNSMSDSIKVNVSLDDGNGASGFLLGEAAPCQISLTNPSNPISLVSVDLLNNILKFNVGATGGAPDGFSYVWNITDDPNAAVLYEEYQGIQFPYTDNDGNLFVRYTCTGNGQSPSDFPLSLSVNIYHQNGSYIPNITTTLTTSGACNPQ